MSEQVKVFFRVMFFSLLILACYTGFANLLPQVRSDPPEPEAPIIAGELSQDDFAALGEKLFSGRGTCTLCHNSMGRAPDLLNMDASAGAKKAMADSRYKGGATDIESYFRESMNDPSSYVVAGFGVKGTDDARSPMPAVNKAPLSLSSIEVDALIAFLQSKDGYEITVSLPSGEAPVEEEEGEESGPVTTAQEVLVKYMCTGCHEVLDAEGGVGPSLKGVGIRRSPEDIRRDILEPNAVIAEGFDEDMMPTDFAEQMRVSELELIVRFLAEDK